ncbi:MAG: cupredoxin domain-containing protein [Myxococcota bacterium]
MATLGALALTAGACKKEPPPAPKPAVAESSPRHSATEHAHTSPRGGIVRSTPTGHLELLVEKRGLFKVYVLDEKLALRPVEGLEGKVRPAIPGYAEIQLSPKEGYLEGTGAPLEKEHFAALVVVSAGETSEMARFGIHLEAGTGEHPGGHGHAHAQGTPAARRTDGDSIIGRLMDSTCLARGEQPTAEHVACAVRCIQNGAPIAIVEDETQQVYIAVAEKGKSVKDMLLPYLGQRSELFGKALKQGGTQLFMVEEIVPEHEHSSHHGGIVAMMGDTHIEVLALKSGEVRLYVTDAFRKPVSLTGMKGTVELQSGQTPVRTAPLLPDESGDFLQAKFEPTTELQVEATIRLPLKEDPSYFITFMLEPRELAASPGRPTQEVSADVRAGVQEVLIKVQGGYEPSLVSLKKGVPVRLRFLRQDTGECSRELKIPAFDVHTELTPMKETVVELTPNKAGEFAFSCGMDMMKGRLVVKD